MTNSTCSPIFSSGFSATILNKISHAPSSIAASLCAAVRQQIIMSYNSLKY